LNPGSRSRVILGLPGGPAAGNPSRGGRCSDSQFLDDFAAPTAFGLATDLEGRAENGLDVVKLLESLPQLRQPLFDQGLNFPARGGPAIPEVEQRRDVLKRQADRLRGADEAETLERLRSVDPVVPLAPAVRPEKPAAFVVTNRRGRHARLPGQAADGVARLHDPHPSKPFIPLQRGGNMTRSRAPSTGQRFGVAWVRLPPPRGPSIPPGGRPARCGPRAAPDGSRRP
jgi:hypothetical protein